MCQLGLLVDGGPALKPASLLSNAQALLEHMEKFRCPGHQYHTPLEGGTRTRQAQIYPPKFCRELVQGLQRQIAEDEAAACFPAEEAIDADPEDEPMGPEDLGPEVMQPKEPSTSAQRLLVQKVHRNLGHLAADELLRIMRAAGA
eukprot:2985038-Alexandrium_andersonii.AAC.1